MVPIVDEPAWILRDGDRDLVRLEDPIARADGWVEYRVVTIGIEDVAAHLAADPSAEARLTAVDAKSGERADELELDRSGPVTPGRLRARGLGTPKKNRGWWSVVFEWMSRV